MNKLTNQVFDFISKNRAGAFATVSKSGVPHVATVFCLISRDFSIYFATRVESKKYSNLSTQPKVSMSFTNEELMTTVQLTGIASRIENLDEEQKTLYRLVTMRHHERKQEPPPIQMYLQGMTAEIAVIKVKPTDISLATFKLLPNGRYKTHFQKIGGFSD